MMRIGIDPGQTGAIAFMRNDGSIKAIIDMPVMAKTHGKGKQVDPYALSTIIVENKDKDVKVLLEQVAAMPGQGVSSSFGFGESLGVVKGVVGALQLPLIMVTPQKWKKNASLTGKDKDAARTLAIQLHPEVSDWLTRKKDIGRADAICIAHFG